jgi:hypothetical protein
MASCKTWALGNRRGSEIQKRRRKKERRKEEKWATWREVRLGVGVSEEKRSLRRKVGDGVKSEDSGCGYFLFFGFPVFPVSSCWRLLAVTNYFQLITALLAHLYLRDSPKRYLLT